MLQRSFNFAKAHTSSQIDVGPAASAFENARINRLMADMKKNTIERSPKASARSLKQEAEATPPRIPSPPMRRADPSVPIPQRPRLKNSTQALTRPVASRMGPCAPVEPPVVRAGRTVKTGSLRGTPRSTVDRISKMHVPPQFAEVDGNTAITCCPLALRYLQDRHFLDKAATIEEGQQAAYPLEEDFCQNGGLATYREKAKQLTLQDISTRALVGGGQLGAFACDVADAMLSQGLQEAQIYLTTPQHALAMRVVHETAGGVHGWALYVYDPAETGTHRKQPPLPFEQAKEVWSGLKMKDFIDIKWYFPANVPFDEAPFAAFSLDRLPLSRPGEFKYHSGFDANRDDLAVQAEIFAAAVQGNFHNIIRDYGNWLEKEGIKGHRAAERLRGKVSQIPGHYAAIRDAAKHNAGEAVTAIGDVLMRLEVSGADAIEVLASKAHKGQPALQVAALRGSGDFLIAFAHTVKKLGIVGADALELLCGNTVDGTPAMLVAAEMADDGHTQYLEAMPEALRILGIEGQAAIDVMQGRSAEGGNALAAAVMNGHFRYIQILADLLKAQGRTGKAALAYLEAPSIGIPALCTAATYGHGSGFLRALAAAAQTLELEPRDVFSLLNGRTDTGVPAATLAAEVDDESYPIELAKLLRKLKMDHHLALDCVLGRSENTNEPSNFRAAQNDGAGYLTGLVHALKDLGVSREEALDALEARRSSDRTPATFMAAQHGGHNYIRRLGWALSQFGIRGEEAVPVFKGNAPVAGDCAALVIAAERGDARFLEAYSDGMSDCGIVGEAARALFQQTSPEGLSIRQSAEERGHHEFVELLDQLIERSAGGAKAHGHTVDASA